MSCENINKNLILGLRGITVLLLFVIFEKSKISSSSSRWLPVLDSNNSE